MTVEKSDANLVWVAPSFYLKVCAVELPPLLWTSKLSEWFAPTEKCSFGARRQFSEEYSRNAARITIEASQAHKAVAGLSGLRELLLDKWVSKGRARLVSSDADQPASEHSAAGIARLRRQFAVINPRMDSWESQRHQYSQATSPARCELMAVSEGKVSEDSVGTCISRIESRVLRLV